MIIFISAILIAAIPHTDDPWAVSAYSALAVIFLSYHFGSILVRIQENQRSIYRKLVDK